jgi:hypothetical protein
VRNGENSAPVPFAIVAVVRPVGYPAKVVTSARTVPQRLCGIKAPVANAIVARCAPDTKGAVRDPVDRTSEFRKPRVRKILGLSYAVEPGHSGQLVCLGS